MEKVPKLLAITGFLKSFLTSSGYLMILRTNNTKRIAPNVPNKYLTSGFWSYNKFPKENNARIKPETGNGTFLTYFILSKF